MERAREINESGGENKAKSLSIYYLMEKEPITREFLESIARNSKSTQRTYAAGLLAFYKFLHVHKKGCFMANIIKTLQKNEIDVYRLLNEFVSFLIQAKHPHSGQPIALQSMYSYMTAVRSFFEFNDIDIAFTKFKRKVKMPKIYREDEEALDAAEIRRIMLSCNNRRMKAYLLVLASSGLRAVEACALRVCDIDYTSSPTKIHVRKEYCKTKVARDVYISDEATSFLKQWLEWKYRERKASYRYKQRIVNYQPQETDVIFTSRRRNPDPRNMYPKVLEEFEKILHATGFDRRKEGLLRRTITLHSFRRHVKTVISDQVSKDYSEWFLGHRKSSYYTMKEPMRREIYATKCMKYLTFLDYEALESRGVSTEAKLEESRQETEMLKKQLHTMQSANQDVETVISDLLKRVKGLEARLKTVPDDD
jgi:integrase